MVRECVALLSVAALGSISSTGCSLILDFDQAAPADAAIDAVYNQAQCDYLEPNDTFAEAQPVTASDTGPAAICENPGGTEDRDFYKFTASGGTAMLSVTFVERVGGDLDIKLYDATGTMIASSREFGATELITCPGAAPSCPALTAATEYVLEVFPGVVGSVNSYSFAITP